MTKIRYGTNCIEREFDSDITVNHLLRDSTILGALNAPSDVYAVSNGEFIEPTSNLSDYSLITLEKRGSDKGIN